jgi:hypothetical protein
MAAILRYFGQQGWMLVAMLAASAIGGPGTNG